MEFNTDIFSQFDKKWALLTAGDTEKFNAMTISWGGMGTLWGKPVVTVYVKPVRYTYGFMNDSEYFTVSFYPEEYKKALGIMGSQSGRDTDKVADAGLSPIALTAPGEDGDEQTLGITFEEAETTLLCKKLYAQDLDITAVPEFAFDKFYVEEAPHRMFIGEVISIL